MMLNVEIEQRLGSFGLQATFSSERPVTALFGRSGSGKSTLLRALAGLDEHVTGSVIAPRSRAVVFQNPRLLPWRRALANVTFALADTGPDSAGRTSALAPSRR